MYTLQVYSSYLGPVKPAMDQAWMPLPTPEWFPVNVTAPVAVTVDTLTNGTVLVLVTSAGPAGELVLTFYHVAEAASALLPVAQTTAAGLSSPGTAVLVACQPTQWSSACGLSVGHTPNGSSVVAVLGLAGTDGTAQVTVSDVPCTSMSAAAVEASPGTLVAVVDVVCGTDGSGVRGPSSSSSPSASASLVYSVPLCWPASGAPCRDCVTPGLACGAPGQPTSPRPPQPGTSSSVALLSTPILNTTLVLRVVADAHCFNCETVNKQADSGLCDNAPTSTPYVLGYQFAELSEWLANPAQPSPCTPTVLAGTFNQGLAPTATLFAPGSSDASGQAVGVAVTHQGLPSGVAGNTQCGVPLAYPGVLLDGWSLPLGTLLR